MGSAPRRNEGNHTHHPYQDVRRRPTLPHPLGCSTIGAGRLNYRVRNVTGCFPSAKTAVTPTAHNQPQRARLLPESHTVDASNTTKWTSPRSISTSQLHPSQGFHLRPINPLIKRGPYPPHRGGRPHLRAGFPLRCLQRLSLPNVANQPCPWRNNWHTRGSSVPVLSY